MCHSGQVVLGINLARSKWDKQFYLELAQLLPQQLSTLISRFLLLDKGKVEFGNLLSEILCYLILPPVTAAAVEVWSTQEKEEKEVKPQVLRSLVYLS